ncbi:MAG: 16S rRNA (cytosine(1402)-N(4))-methyltransferase RsmH [Acidobacteria bacterium]|nr:MAG: 16S rRNA (cytosine(1402)-N(4))-methyltransferase RsmH [Acidobacteriota bacterium]
MLFENQHKPVLLAEAIKYLSPIRGVFVDATIGLGGHAEAILDRSENVELVGIDQDKQAIEIAKQRLKRFGDRVKIIHANFADIKLVLNRSGVEKVDGILADLGVSSLQLDDKERGFSFRFDAKLDMRMNPDAQTRTAADLLKTLSEEEIADIILRYGEEKFARQIAKKIVMYREAGKHIETTLELAKLVEEVIGGRRREKIHPATRTFQALRIAVNRELEVLEKFIFDAIDVLKNGGRFVVISFHSLEDRLVKTSFLRLSGKCMCPKNFPECVCGAKRLIEILTRKPVRPSEAEKKENPRSRSAKLRACLKRCEE